MFFFEQFLNLPNIIRCNIRYFKCTRPTMVFDFAIGKYVCIHMRIRLTCAKSTIIIYTTCNAHRIFNNSCTNNVGKPLRILSTSRKPQSEERKMFFVSLKTDYRDLLIMLVMLKYYIGPLFFLPVIPRSVLWERHNRDTSLCPEAHLCCNLDSSYVITSFIELDPTHVQHRRISCIREEYSMNLNINV